MSSNLTKILSGEPLPLIPAAMDPEIANWARTVNLYLEALSGTFQSENVSRTIESDGGLAHTHNYWLDVQGNNSAKNFITDTDMRGRDFQIQVYAATGTPTVARAKPYSDVLSKETTKWFTAEIRQNDPGTAAYAFSAIGLVSMGAAPSTDVQLFEGNVGSSSPYATYDIYIDATTGKLYINIAGYTGTRFQLRTFVLASDQTLTVDYTLT